MQEIQSLQFSAQNSPPQSESSTGFKKRKLFQIVIGLVLVFSVIVTVLFLPGDYHLPDVEHPPGPNNPLGKTKPDPLTNEFVTDNLTLNFAECQPRTYVLPTERTNTTTTFEVIGITELQSSAGSLDYCSMNIMSEIGPMVSSFSCLIPPEVGQIELKNKHFGIDSEFQIKYCKDLGSYLKENVQ
ncbi:MAG: hypothetical protein WAU07_02130 [Microgenomates group bacterium]